MHGFVRIRRGLRAVKIAAIRQCGATDLQSDHEQERERFHGRIIKLDCTMSIHSALLRTSLAVSFLSVRGYGLRTDETRQGRNAATVV